MTTTHADNLSRRMRDLAEEFDRAEAAGCWSAARKGWRELLFAVDVVIREARAARIEAEVLACELSTYRPMRADRPAAPGLDGYCYVFTARFPWVCVAVELRKLATYTTLAGGFTQEHWVPEKQTLCGRATAFPVKERFTSGGWPRMHELCPDCTGRLVQMGLISPPAVEPT